MRAGINRGLEIPTGTYAENDFINITKASTGQEVRVDVETFLGGYLGDLTVAEKITHAGDTDTFIQFTDDFIGIEAGGRDFVNFTESTQDEVRFNPGSVDIDFIVKGSGGATVLGYDYGTNAITATTTETIAAAGAISNVVDVTKLALAGAGAVTLAAPGTSMIGRVKTIEMTVDNGDVTLALTNVQGQSSGTTATFNDVGDSLTLVGANNSKWTVLKEFGVGLA